MSMQCAYVLYLCIATVIVTTGEKKCSTPASKMSSNTITFHFKTELVSANDIWITLCRCVMLLCNVCILGILPHLIPISWIISNWSNGMSRYELCSRWNVSKCANMSMYVFIICVENRKIVCVCVVQCKCNCIVPCVHSFGDFVPFHGPSQLPILGISSLHSVLLYMIKISLWWIYFLLSLSRLLSLSPSIFLSFCCCGFFFALSPLSFKCHFVAIQFVLFSSIVSYNWIL